jgi:DNA polymerase-4
MNQTGIWFGRDLKKLDRHELLRLFGKAGNYYYEICRGEDHRQVEPVRERKSVGAEQTFLTDLYLETELESQLLNIVEILWRRIQRTKVKAKTLTLKYKYADFEQHTRSKTIAGYFENFDEIISEVKTDAIGGGFIKGIRLLGLSVTNFLHDEISKPVQLTIKF